MLKLQLGHLVKTSGKGASLRLRQPRRLRPGRPSRANELWYKAELLKLVRHISNVAEVRLEPVLQSMVRSAAFDGMTHDANTSLMSELNALAKSFGGIGITAKRLAALAIERNLKAVDTSLAAAIRASVGIDVSGFFTKAGPIRDAMSFATKANIELITSIPTQYLEKVAAAVEKNFVAGVRWEDLAKSVAEVGDVTESRAKLIARDQTSKMNSAFNSVRQTSLGIDQYIWQTSGDERVREEHAANDGQIFNWDKPPATGHPGEDINCRCVAIPYFNLDQQQEDLGL